MKFPKSSTSSDQGDKEHLLSLTTTSDSSKTAYVLDLPTLSSLPAQKPIQPVPNKRDVAEMLDDENTSWVPSRNERR